MALVQKLDENTNTLTTGAAWQGGSVPGYTNTATFGSLLNTVNSFTMGTTLQLGALRVSDDCPQSTITSTAGVNSYNFNVRADDASSNNGRSVYVGVNKSLIFNHILLLAAPAAGGSQNHAVEVAAGGVLQPDRTTTATTATGSQTATKYGDGIWWFGRSTTTTGTIGLAGLTIARGTVKMGGASGSAPIQTTATITFNAEAGATPTFQFENDGTGSTRSLPNPVSMTTAGTLVTPSGFTATMTGAASGAGTLSLSGTGSLTWDNAISCPLAIPSGSSLTMGGTSGALSSMTLSGAGTLNMNGRTLTSVSGAGFTGAINNNFTANSTTLAGVIAGTASTDSGDTTYSYTGTHGGQIGTVGYANVYIYGLFNGGGGTTSLNGGGTEGQAIGGLSLYGAGSLNATRTVQLTNRARLGFFTGASLSSPTTSAADSSITRIQTGDTSSCTYSGNHTASSKTSGSVRIQAFTGGTFTLAGSFTSGGASFSLNTDSGYAGTLKMTGSGFSGGAVTLPSGKLHINSAASFNVGTGLSVTGTNTTVACSSTGAYAANINGSVNFGAGTILKFGAP